MATLKNIDPTIRRWINQATYEEMLIRWRAEPPGSTMFQGDLGEHFVHTMRRKGKKYTAEQRRAFSKKVGWDGKC